MCGQRGEFICCADDGDRELPARMEDLGRRSLLELHSSHQIELGDCELPFVDSFPDVVLEDLRVTPADISVSVGCAGGR